MPHIDFEAKFAEEILGNSGLRYQIRNKIISLKKEERLCDIDKDPIYIECEKFSIIANYYGEFFNNVKNGQVQSYIFYDKSSQDIVIQSYERENTSKASEIANKGNEALYLSSENIRASPKSDGLDQNHPASQQESNTSNNNMKDQQEAEISKLQNDIEFVRKILRERFLVKENNNNNDNNVNKLLNQNNNNGQQQ